MVLRQKQFLSLRGKRAQNRGMPSRPLNRRDFIKTTSAAAAVVALAPGPLRAEDSAPGKMIGIQAGAVSFVDEGTDQVLDILQERGAVNTLFLAAFT